MPWLYVVLAGFFEVGWAYSLKQSEGFTKVGPSLLTLAFMAISFLLLAQGVRTLPLGTAYAVWTGLGAVGTALVGIIFLNEPRDIGRIACIFMIAAGIVGLKLVTK